MAVKDTLEIVLLIARIVFWVVMIAIAVVGFFFIKHTTDTISARLDAGQAPFSLNGLIDTNALAQNVAGQVSEGIVNGQTVPGTSAPTQYKK